MRTWTACGGRGAVEKGAAGVLSKTTHLHEVVDAVRRLLAGETLIPLDEVVELLRFAGRKRERELGERRLIESLTAREREILQLLTDGLDGSTMAARLYISPRTQRNHVANILGKLRRALAAAGGDLRPPPRGRGPALTAGASAPGQDGACAPIPPPPTSVRLRGMSDKAAITINLPREEVERRCSWDGYAVDRQRVLDFLKERGSQKHRRNHGRQAPELRAQRGRTLSPTSPGRRSPPSSSAPRSASGGDTPPRTAHGGDPLNPHILFENFQRGYVRVELDQELWRSDFRVVETVSAARERCGLNARALDRSVAQPGALPATSEPSAPA